MYVIFSNWPWLFFLDELRLCLGRFAGGPNVPKPAVGLNQLAGGCCISDTTGCFFFFWRLCFYFSALVGVNKTINRPLI